MRPWYFGLGRRRPFGERNIAGRPRGLLDPWDIGRAMRVATLSEMLEEVVRLGEATGMEEHAHEMRGELEGRLATVRAAVAGAPSPRVIALERLDPARVAGFWIPEMISIAGGEDVAGDPGINPAEVGWGELESLRAEVVVVMLDGSLEDARAQAMEHWERIAALGAGRVFAVETGDRLRRAGAAPGRRRRAARPPAPPRPDGPAGQHRLRGAAGAVRALGRLYSTSGDGDRADERDRADRDHQDVLGDPVVRPEHAALPGDDHQRADRRRRSSRRGGRRR